MVIYGIVWYSAVCMQLYCIALLNIVSHGGVCWCMLVCCVVVCCNVWVVYVDVYVCIVVYLMAAILYVHLLCCSVC